MRVAFTIIYNGLHHLQHKGFADFMISNFDHWVVVEGHARPNGSTRWCRKLNISPRSTDGTHEYMIELESNHSNVHYVSPGRYWMSKDHQVNKALEVIRQYTQDCYLWEVDCDEHWTKEKLIAAEAIAENSSHICFAFQFNHFVGPRLIAHGEWGDGCLNRLWKWTGQPFRSHEPAVIMGQRSAYLIPDIKFDHYSYYFEKDVAFKASYYKDHEQVLDKWHLLQSMQQFPVHISSLFGSSSKIGSSKSYIDEIRN